MTLEFLEEREAVRDNPFISRVPTTVMDFPKVINCCGGLKRLRIAKTAIVFAIFAGSLAVFGHGFVVRWMVMEHVS
jgi:hypothetical protein